MKIDDQLQILTAYRDNVPIEVRSLPAEDETVIYDKWLPIAKPSHSASGAHLFDFRTNEYRIQPPRAELWVVWNVTLARVVQTGPFESAADATKKCLDFARGPRAPGESVDQYIPVRVHTDVSQA